jgi:hypothetical protein
MKRTLLALSLALIVAGCSTNTARPASQTTSAAQPAPTTVENSPKNPAPLGTTLSFSGDRFTGDKDLQIDVTVFGFAHNVAPNAALPSGGGHWVGADVQTCLKKTYEYKNFTVSSKDWSVTDSKDGPYDSSDATDPDFPMPRYPVDNEPVAVGECTRGWVLFLVAADADVVLVKFRPRFGAPAFWATA